MSPRRAARSLATALAVAAGLAAGCSLVVDTNAVQCSTDADCASRGTGSRCTSRNVCSVAVAGAACATNAACSRAAGAPAICRASDKACVPLLSDQCKTLWGSVDVEGTVLLGSILPTSGALADTGVPVRRSLELALSDIAQVAQGLPAATSGGAPRPLAVLECDEATDAVAAARHLATDLGVPGFFGPFTSDAALAVATQVAIPTSTLMLTPGATVPSLAQIGGGRFVWRTAPSDVYQAKALDALVPVLEAKHRFQWEIPSTTKIRAAMLVRGDAYGIQLADTMLASKITLNGQSAVQNGSDYFKRIDYGDASTGAAVDYAGVIGSTIAFKPDLVIFVGGAEVATGIVGPMEAAWPQGTSAPPKPWYVMSHEARTPTLAASLAGNDDLRRRIWGTQAGVDNGLLDSFVVHYDGTYDAAQVFGMANAYDAGFLMTLAAVAAGPSLTGPTLADGFRRLVGGKAENLSVTDLLDASGVLAGGGTITPSGATGPLVFDPALGQAPSDVDVWCGKLAGAAAVLASSGLIYDATKDALTGDASSCEQ